MLVKIVNMNKMYLLSFIFSNTHMNCLPQQTSQYRHYPLPCYTFVIYAAFYDN